MPENSYLFKRQALNAERVIKGLASRNMTGYYAATREEALRQALALIPEGSSVSMGGATSVHDIGLVDALKAGNFQFIDREQYEDPREAYLDSYDADVYLTSVNALTEDGVLVNIDGNANRVSALAYGPRRIIAIVGLHKVCPDIDSAMKRARNIAAPANALRVGAQTPCTHTGSCSDCKSVDTVCCQFLITRFSRHADRIHIILVNEEIGF